VALDKHPAWLTMLLRIEAGVDAAILLVTALMG
jgi:hypothetical protein